MADTVQDSTCPERGELYAEAKAWTWALQTALVPPSRRTWRTIYRAWRSYVLDEATVPVFDPRWLDHMSSGGASMVPAWARLGYVRLWLLVRARGRVRVRRVRGRVRVRRVRR